MRLYPALLLALGLALIVGTADGGGKDAGLKALQGRWEVVKMETDGKPVPAKHVKGSTFVVDGHEYVFKGGDETYQGVLTVDTAAKPNTIIATFRGEGGKEKGRAVGIYEVQGDKLKILWDEKGKNRPKAFNDKKGNRYLVLERHGKK